MLTLLERVILSFLLCYQKLTGTTMVLDHVSAQHVKWDSSDLTSSSLKVFNINVESARKRRSTFPRPQTTSTSSNGCSFPWLSFQAHCVFKENVVNMLRHFFFYDVTRFCT